METTGGEARDKQWEQPDLWPFMFTLKVESAFLAQEYIREQEKHRDL